MSIFRRRRLELSSNKEVVAASRIPNRKERNYIENRLAVPSHRFTDFKSYLDAGSGKVWASFRACHLAASVFMGTDFRMVRPKDPSWVPTPGVDEAFIFTDPNPFDSWREMLYLWVFHIKLTGCAFWLKDEVNGLGQPTRLYPLMPQYVKVVPDAKKNIAGFIYEVNGKRINYAPEEIIYFRRPHPASTLWGMGDVEPSETLFNQYINRAVYEEKFLENGAQPSGVLTLKEAPDDPGDWERLKAWWNKEYAGKANAGKTAFLTGEWMYHKLGIDQQAMQTLEREKTTVEQIFINHGVPLSIAGIREAANYATAKQDEINFRKYEIVPLLELFCGKLNREGVFFSHFKSGTVLEYDLSGLVDVEQIVKEYAPLVKLGALTPNELRQLVGLSKIEDPYLDQYFVENGLTPLEMAGMPPLGGEGDPAVRRLEDYTKLK